MLKKITEFAQLINEVSARVSPFLRNNVLILCSRDFSINLMVRGMGRMYSIYYEDQILHVDEGLNEKCRICFTFSLITLEKLLSEKERVLKYPVLLLKYFYSYFGAAAMLDDTYFEREIEGERVRLRAFRPEEAQEILLWYMDRELNRLAGFAYTEPNLEKIESNMRSGFGNDPMNLVIEYIPTGEIIGTIQLYDINKNDGNCMLGIRIGRKDFQGLGIGGEAARLIVDFAFRKMNLRRVSLKVYEYNMNAKKCYEKVGFEVEGRLRKSAKIENQYYDEILMSILNPKV